MLIFQQKYISEETNWFKKEHFFSNNIYKIVFRQLNSALKVLEEGPNYAFIKDFFIIAGDRKINCVSL
jgi:hypothetical protein